MSRIDTNREAVSRVVRKLTDDGYEASPDGASVRCKSPAGLSFAVKVHAVSNPNWFTFSESLLDMDHPEPQFVVFVILSNGKFYVLNRTQLVETLPQQKLRNEQRARERGELHSQNYPATGCEWRLLEERGYLDAWRSLPQ